VGLAVRRRSRPRGETRRAQILDAAMAVFLEHGYAGATVELVVQRAQASKATIYSFFGGKEGLFDALIDERAERILAGFTDVERATVNVRAALRHIAQRYLQVAMAPEAIALYRLLVTEGPRYPELVRGVFRIGQDRVVASLARALRTWVTRGRIRAVDPDRIAMQFLAVARGDLHLRAMAGLLPDDLEQAIERSVDDAVETFWRALSPKAERGPGPSGLVPSNTHCAGGAR
jgi:AcrR family transcriptional regulator